MRDHHSLRAWREARAVVLRVVALSESAWRPWAAAIFGQLQRSSLSVQLNVAEGYALRGSARFAWHLRVAYASAVETGDLLGLLHDAHLISPEVARELIDGNDASQKLIWGLLRSLPPDGT